MKRRLGAVECDTRTARLIGEADGLRLFRTKSKKYFVEDIQAQDVCLIDDKEAHSWILKNLGAAKYKAAFEEEKTRKISLDLPVSLVDKIDAARDDVKRTRRAVIESALKEVFDHD